MATKAIWEQLRDHRDADPEHQRLSEAHSALIKEHNAIEHRLRSGTYKIQRLLLARDAVIEFAGRTETTDPEQDQQLLEWTATHGESWCGMFSGAADDITELVLDICAGLALERTARDQTKERREAAYQDMRACADRLDAAYKEKHAGTAGPAA
jgi:hypothetical protein